MMSNTRTTPVVVALDFETADHEPDSACALGMVKVLGTEIADRLYTLIRPPRRKILFTHIHGLTWAMLREQPSFVEQWPRFADFLAEADYLVAHNAVFDRRVLYACCQAAAVPLPPAPFVCTVKGARQSIPISRHRLCDVCAHLGFDLDHHHAASDALAAARIYLYLREKGLPVEAMLI